MCCRHIVPLKLHSAAKRDLSSRSKRLPERSRSKMLRSSKKLLLGVSNMLSCLERAELNAESLLMLSNADSRLLSSKAVAAETFESFRRSWSSHDGGLNTCVNVTDNGNSC